MPFKIIEHTFCKKKTLIEWSTFTHILTNIMFSKFREEPEYFYLDLWIGSLNNMESGLRMGVQIKS